MNPAIGSLAALFAGVLGAGLLLVPAPLHRPPVALPVRLAVLVVFDQMRGDLLARWRPLFGPNGTAPDAARGSTDELARVIDAHLTKRRPPLVRPAERTPGGSSRL